MADPSLYVQALSPGYSGRRSLKSSARQRMIADALSRGTQTSPTTAAGGWARAGQGLIGGLGAGWLLRKEGEDEANRAKAISEAIKNKDYAAAIEADPDNAARWAQLGLMQDIYGKKQAADLSGARAAIGSLPGGAPVPQEAPPQVQQQPLPAIPQQGDDFSRKNAQVESGGNPTAVNPYSGAYGKHQFMPGTADDVRRNNPNLNLPADVRQWTPEQQDAAEQALRRSNAGVLARTLGREPTQSEIRLAHYFGAGGAGKLLQLPPQTRFADIPDGFFTDDRGRPIPTATVIRQNPNLARETPTIGDLAGAYARQFDGAQPQVAGFKFGPGGQMQPRHAPPPIGAFDAFEAPQMTPVAGAPSDVLSQPGTTLADLQQQPPAQQAQTPAQPQPFAPQQAQAPQFDPGAPYEGEARRLRAQAEGLVTTNPAEAKRLAEEARKYYLQAEAERAKEQGRRQDRAPQGYRMNPDGTMSHIPGGPADPTVKPQNKPMGQSAIDKLGEAGGSAVDFTRLGNTFKPEYGGYRLDALGNADNWIGRNITGDNSGQAQWWQDYQSSKNLIRHKLFGSALTATEKAEFDKANVSPGMQPAEIQKNLARQQQLAMIAASKMARAWSAQGYSKDAIEAALGIPLDQLPPPTAGYDAAPQPQGQPAPSRRIRIDAQGNVL